MSFYPPISLHKDGAFMLCEDASELDMNYDAPVTPEPEAKVVIIAMKDEDPLDKFANKMSVLYDQIVEPMLNMDYSYDNPQQAIDMCERLTSDTSTIFNVMRIKLLKFAGIVCGGVTEDLAKEAFRAHAGTFMKNAGLVKQQGIETYPVSWMEHPGFTESWMLETLVNSIKAKPNVLDEMIYGQELNALIGYDSNGMKCFNGFVDMMQCIFRDKERLNRLSVKNNYNLRFADLMAGGTSCENGSGECCMSKDIQRMLISYLNMLASRLREVSQCCYELQIGIVDNTVTPEEYEHCVRPKITAVVNLFGLGVAIGCYLATCLRRAIAIQRGCEEYTKVLLNTIKDCGGKV